MDVNELIPRENYPPGMGAVCESLKPAGTDLPHYVALPTVLGWGFALDRPGPHGGFLGKKCDPLWSTTDPKIDPKPPAGRRPMWLGEPRLADTKMAADMTIDRFDDLRAAKASGGATSEKDPRGPAHARMVGSSTRRV